MDPILESLRVLAAPPQWLTAGADGARVARALRGALSLENGGAAIRTCRVEDLRLTGTRWIGRYVVTVDGPGGPVRDVALTGVLARCRCAGRPPGVEAPTGGQFEGRDWSASLTDPPLTLSLAGEDRETGRAPTSYRTYGGTGVARATLSDTFPTIKIISCDPRVARYRPGQRCTVVCHLTYGAEAEPTWPQTVIAKVHRHGEGAPAYGALQALAEVGFGSTGPLRIARPLGYVADDDVSLQSYLPKDRDLGELVRQATAGSEVAMHQAEVALRVVADAITALHKAAVRYGPVTVLGDEISSARRAAVRLWAVFPELEGAVEPLLRLVEERAIDVGPDPIRPSHGAFRPAQVRIYGERAGLLDLDGFGQCEPGQDVGRFVAKLRLVALGAAVGSAVDLPTRVATADRLAATFLERYRVRATVSPVRVTLWESLDLVKALLQSWSRVRPTQIEPVLTLLEHRVAELRPQTASS